MTGRAYAGLRVLPSARELRPDERTVIDQLLSAPFEGRDAIRSQLANARVVAEGEADTRTIKFELAPGERRLALTKLRVPVEAEILDEDRVPIALLLHVLDGLATELEIFRADGQPIKQRDLTTLRSVVVNEARWHRCSPASGRRDLKAHALADKDNHAPPRLSPHVARWTGSGQPPGPAVMRMLAATDTETDALILTVDASGLQELITLLLRAEPTMLPVDSAPEGRQHDL